MANTNFRCTGIWRDTGDPVAVELTANDSESAIAVANARGILVEDVTILLTEDKPTNAIRNFRERYESDQVTEAKFNIFQGILGLVFGILLLLLGLGVFSH